ncbi:MAG TPA: zinc-binding dehydrogenase [Anaerolineae bacterium]|nr:zinc-binding dehydrogenase [Anaerolineae bacterium]
MVTSRYAELVEPGKFTLKEETLAPNDDQLLIRITHCGICQYDGVYYKGIIGQTPMSIGHEPVGVVEAVGPKVQGFEPGDRVTGLYAYLRAFATYGLAEPEQLIKVPDHVPSEQALGEPLKCIGTILRAGPPEFGDHVLVMGCGFMGLLVLAGLVGRGVASLIAADIREDRLALAKEIGATHTVNASDPDFLAKVDEITQGHGADVVFELTSSAEPVELAAKTLRRTRGRYVLAGWHGQPGTYTLRNWTTRGAIILTAHPSFSLDQFEDMRRAMDGLARGVFPMDRLITHRFALDEIQTAFEIAMTGADGYIKGVITP